MKIIIMNLMKLVNRQLKRTSDNSSSRIAMAENIVIFRFTNLSKSWWIPIRTWVVCSNTQPMMVLTMRNIRRMVECVRIELWILFCLILEENAWVQREHHRAVHIHANRRMCFAIIFDFYSFSRDIFTIAKTEHMLMLLILKCIALLCLLRYYFL